jgi:hypothetical protein
MGDIVTATGTRFWIGPITGPDVDTTTEFAALAWVEVGLVETYGEIGDEAAAVNFAAVGDGRVRKSKGARDAGTMALTVGHDPTDLGQMAMEAAEGTNKNYAFKMVLPDRPDEDGTDTVQYFRGLVMSRRRNIGGNDNVIRRTYAIAINTEIYEVPAAAGVGP